MRLLLYPVSLIPFIVISIATPPPGYVKPTNYDKDPPKYEYRYEIANGDGNQSQGKSETRSGEMASGRYYVNGEKSTTDVKYYADEWGYHPLVKYRASNDHSVATTHFALGEHVVKSLLNGSEVGDEVKLQPLRAHQDRFYRRPFRRRRPVQLVQPYTPVLAEAAASTTSQDVISSNTPETVSIDETSDVNFPHNFDNQRTSVPDSKLRHAGILSTMSFEQNFNNYVTLPKPSSESVENSERSTSDKNHFVHQEAFSSSIIPTTDIPDHQLFTPTDIYSESSTASPWSSEKVSSQSEQSSRANDESNHLFSTLSDDILQVENAGSFGRRIKATGTPSALENSSRPKSHRKIVSSTPQPSYDISTSRSSQQVSEGNVENGASSYVSYSTGVTPRTNGVTYSTSIPTDTGYFSSTQSSGLDDLHNSVATEGPANDYEKTITDVRHRDNAVSGSYSGSFARFYPNDHGDQGIGHKLNSLIIGNSNSVRYKGDEKNGSSIVETGRATTSGVRNYGTKVDHQLYVTLRQSLDSEIRDMPSGPSATPSTLLTYSSKPIVVAELPSQGADKGVEYSTTFPCHHEESTTIIPSVSSTYSSKFAEDSLPLFVTPELTAYQTHITTSSVILNPIQAGVSLVNADQTELIRSENQEGRSPAPVNENIGEDGSTASVKNVASGHGNELGKIVTGEARSKFYETLNPAYVQSTLGKSIGTGETGRNLASNVVSVDGNTGDQQIEIQKSVEIYQSAPVHEIHYPPQVITQVSGINHLREQEVKQHRENIAELLHQRDEVKEAGEASSSYVELQDVGNAKQFHSPLQIYNSEEKVSHESRGTQLSSENVGDSSLIEASVYHGNHVRQDNELLDYPMERNNGPPTLLPGREDGPRIIKLIRDSIPEVKYTPAKTQRINVKVYPALSQTNENEQSYHWSEKLLGPEQQRDQTKSGNQDATKKAQSQLHKILSESESVQRYLSRDAWTKFQTQEHQQQQHQQQQQEQQEQQQQQQQQDQQQQQQREQQNQLAREYQELQGNYQVQENIDEPRQPLEQSIVQPWVQFDTSGLKNIQENTGSVIDDNPTTFQAIQQLHSSGSTQERIVEKTIHVPQPYPVEVPRIIEKKVPYPVEKIVERKVPYPVEKIIEKKVPVPHPYPVHIQVPVDRVVEKQVQILQPYPVHIEKIIEKKVPYPVQKLVPQPYPVHILQPYPVEKIIEKPVHIPVTIEKIVEKKVHVPQPYPVQIPIKLPYPVEITKYVENTVAVPYGVRYGVSYQQIMKPQSYKGLYGSQSTVSVPLYGLSLVSNHNRDRERPNVTHDFQGYNYDKPAIPFASGAVDSFNIDQQRSNGWEKFAYDKPSSGQDNGQRYQTFSKKSYHSGYASKTPPLTYSLRNYSGSNRRQVSYRHNNGPTAEQSIGKDEYVGPVPVLKYNSPHQIVRSRSSTDQQQHQSFKQPHSTAVPRPSPSATLSESSRRTRQQEQSPHFQSGPGAFRQSKIEYGFKPPMVPSVQYDEKTATKVEK